MPKKPKITQKQLLKALKKFITVAALAQLLEVNQITARGYLKSLEGQLETQQVKSASGRGRPAVAYRLNPTVNKPDAEPAEDPTTVAVLDQATLDFSIAA